MSIATVKALHASPWKGIVSEVGLGLEFSASLVREPGASNTIIAIESDYANVFKPYGMRAVSLEYAKHMANYGLARSNDWFADKALDNTYAFGLASTAVHYTDRMSHAWVALKTNKFEAYMHVNFTYITPNREAVGKELAKAIYWFIEGTLLHTRSWKDLIATKPDYIDVLYAPGVSDIERLGLLTAENPLLYHNGKFHRTVDYLRDSKAIYAGSFNPPHNEHLTAGKDALFRIGVHAQGKGFISAEDMLHRLRMLDLLKVPVVIVGTLGMFYQDDQLFRKLWKKGYVHRVGSDTWNRLIKPEQYPNENFLGQAMQDSEFEIYNRGNEAITQNGVSEHLKYRDSKIVLNSISSTDIREHKIPLASNVAGPEVYDYICTHKLYGYEYP